MLLCDSRSLLTETGAISRKEVRTHTDLPATRWAGSGPPAGVSGSERWEDGLAVHTGRDSGRSAFVRMSRANARDAALVQHRCRTGPPGLRLSSARGQNGAGGGRRRR